MSTQISLQDMELKKHGNNTTIGKEKRKINVRKASK